MQKPNILIVDDREENLIALQALIQRNDVSIIGTTSPNEALKLAWENDISIALIDVQMPEIDGFELAEMLKTNPRTKDILIIFVTAISKDTKYVVKGLNVGAIDYLYKPLDPHVTTAKVDSFIQLAKAQYEIKIKNQELENFAIMVNNSPDIICSIDAKTNQILSISPALEKLTSFKRFEVEGKNIIDFLVDEERPAFETKLKKLADGEQTNAVSETRFNIQNNQTMWVEYRAAYKSGVHFLNMSDITAQKEFQNQLIEAKNQAEHARKVKEIFLANMSHELRTPINGIIGIANLLSTTHLDDSQKQMIHLLEVSSQSLLGVVNDILDISKIESGKFSIVKKEINLREQLLSITDLLRFKANEKLIKLELIIDELVPKFIIADGLRLGQILMNLLSNAIKFTKEGKVVLKVVTKQHLSDAVILNFSVEDTGIGIPEDKIGRIFESYEQADDDTAIVYGGTGLGLTIVKKLVELKGGNLTVTSKLGVGSVFSFENKFAIEHIFTHFNTDNNPDLSSFKGKRVLLAEDNLVSQFMITKILNKWEVEVEAVDNGLKVIEALKHADYNLILMDTHMPELGGYDTTKRIREELVGEKREIPIISLSAAVLEEEKHAALAAGMDDVLTKPFKSGDLHLILSKFLA